MTRTLAMAMHPVPPLTAPSRRGSAQAVIPAWASDTGAAGCSACEGERRILVFDRGVAGRFRLGPCPLCAGMES